MPVTVERFVKSPREERWDVTLSDGTTFRADVALIADHSLYTGRELDEEELAALRSAVSRRHTGELALRILGARMLSKKELLRRLVDKGETEEDAAAAVETLERAGVLNDGEYAGAIVRHYTKLGYGTGRVREELYRRGVPKELWEDALRENLPEDGDAIGALLEKRLRGRKPDRKELKRVTDMLLRRGFGWGEIKAALSKYEFSEELDGIDE